MFAFQPAQERKTGIDRQKSDRGAQIPLKDHQDHGHQSDQTAHPQFGQLEMITVGRGVVLGQRQDDQDLDQFGRLEGQNSQAEPALVVVNRAADHKHQRKEDKPSQVGKRDEVGVNVVIKVKQNQENHQGQAQIDNLPAKVVADAGPLSRTPDGREPGRRQEKQGEKPEPIETNQHAPVHYHRASPPVAREAIWVTISGWFFLSK